MFETNLWLLEHSYRDQIVQSWAHTLKANSEELCKRIHDTSVEEAKMSFYAVQDNGGDSASISVMPNQSEVVQSSGGSVAVIPIIGAMQRDFSYYYKSTSTTNVINNIRLANADPEVNSIVLYIDSGGGTVSGTYELGEAIKKSKKPILGAIVDSCCSAALWAGSQADFLYATTPTSGIGSIGVITSHQEISNLLENIGIKIEFITSTGDEAKAYGNPAEPLSEDARAYITDRLNTTKEIFKATVLKGRGDRIQDSNEAITAKVLSPKVAKSVGLIDGIMSLETVVVMANRQGKKYRREQQKSNVNKSRSTSRASSSNSPLNNVSMSKLDKYIKVVHKEERTFSAEELTQLEASVDALESKVETLESTLAEEAKAKKDLQDQLATSNTSKKDAEDKLSSTVADFNVEKQKLNDQVSDLTTKLTASQEEVDKLKADVSTKDTRISELEAELAKSKEEAEKAAKPEVEEKVEENAEATKLKEQMAELEAEKAKIAEEYNKLAAQVGNKEKKPAEGGAKTEKKSFSYADLRHMSLSERMAFEKQNRGAGKILTMGAIKNK